MFDGIKGLLKDVARGVASRPEESPLSIVPQKKAGDFSFDTVSAGWYGQNGYPRIYSALNGGLPAWRGEPVSTATSIGLSTVWAFNKVMAESVSLVSLNMMSTIGNKKEEAVVNPKYRARHHATN